MTAGLPPLARSVLETLSDALFVFDSDGRLIHANAEGKSLLREVALEQDARFDRIWTSLAPRGARAHALTTDGVKHGDAVLVPTGVAARNGTLAERERAAILETLRATGWRLTESARRLGISRTTLWRRLHAYGLERPGAK